MKCQIHNCEGYAFGAFFDADNEPHARCKTHMLSVLETSGRPQEVFCWCCGSRLSMRPNGQYDEMTGTQIEKPVCLNPKCERGCSNTIGHRYGFFSQDVCRECGYRPPNY